MGTSLLYLAIFLACLWLLFDQFGKGGKQHLTEITRSIVGDAKIELNPLKW